MPGSESKSGGLIPRTSQIFEQKNVYRACPLGPLLIGFRGLYYSLGYFRGGWTLGPVFS